MTLYDGTYMIETAPQPQPEKSSLILTYLRKLLEKVRPTKEEPINSKEINDQYLEFTHTPRTDAATFTGIGGEKRFSINYDHMAVTPAGAVLADGVSHELGGKYIAQSITEKTSSKIEKISKNGTSLEQLLRIIIDAACEASIDLQQELMQSKNAQLHEGSYNSTTLVTSLITVNSNQELLILTANSGDSLSYLIPIAGDVIALTTNHSVGHDLTKSITAAGMSNGTVPTLEMLRDPVTDSININMNTAKEGDIVLSFTDGLEKYLLKPYMATKKIDDKATAIAEIGVIVRKLIMDDEKNVVEKLLNLLLIEPKKFFSPQQRRILKKENTTFNPKNKISALECQRLASIVSARNYADDMTASITVASPDKAIRITD